MARYEYSDGNSSKFWKISLEETSLTVCYGRIGSAGLSSTKTFADRAEMEKEARLLIQAKLRQGYVLVTADEPEPESDEPRNPDLEREIYENPDDPEPWRAYGEWLQSSGDPRGELILLELRRPEANEFERRRIARRTREIAHAHQHEWMSPTLREIYRQADKRHWRRIDQVLKLDWRGGFIVSARVASQYDWQGVDPPEMLRVVFLSSSARFCRRLALGHVFDEEGEVDYDELLWTIADIGELPALRELRVGDFKYPEECEISFARVGDLSQIYGALPHLETLHAQGSEIRLGELKHPRLQRLVLETGGLPGGAVMSVMDADLPELRDLEMWFGQDVYGAEAEIEMLEPLMAGRLFPKLERLALRNAEFTDDIAEALVASEILVRLEELDLSLGVLTDEGARLLLRHADRLRHLRTLNLDENFVHGDVAEKLRAELPSVSLSDQKEHHDWDPDYFFPSVGR